MIVTGEEGRNMAIGTTLVAGNWKMNGLLNDGAALAHELAERAIATDGGLGCELLVCPPATLLSTVGTITASSVNRGRRSRSFQPSSPDRSRTGPARTSSLSRMNLCGRLEPA